MFSTFLCGAEKLHVGLLSLLYIISYSYFQIQQAFFDKKGEIIQGKESDDKTFILRKMQDWDKQVW